MATEKSWDPSVWPTPDQLDDWLQRAEPHERMDFILDALRAMQENTARALRGMAHRVGTGQVTIEDIGPVLDAFAERQVQNWDDLAPVQKMKIKNVILSETLPGIELLLSMVNAAVAEYMRVSEFRVLSKWRSKDGARTAVNEPRPRDSLAASEAYAAHLMRDSGVFDVVIEARNVSEWVPVKEVQR